VDQEELLDEEKELFRGVYHSIYVNEVRGVKKTLAVRMRDVWNKHYPDEWESYCMCSHFKRYHLVKKFLKRFEGRY
jgi:hypothetical protein